MSDRKSFAIGLGIALGIGAVATTVAIYSARHRETAPRDINEIFDAARHTVQKLDEALDVLRKSTKAS